MKIATHNARFHADDVFAAATLIELYPKAELVRTRDQTILDTAEIIFDVGNVYDPEKLRFDHHQAGGAGKRDNGIPYASFGLVWKHFGFQLCGDQSIVDAIDKKLVQSIDAMDNGVDLGKNVFESGPFQYTAQTIVSTFGPTWKEDPEKTDISFMEVVSFARKIIQREITQARHFLESEKIILEAYKNTKDKRIIVLDNNYPWTGVLIKFSEPLFVVRPNLQTSDWKVEAVPVKLMNYENRKKLPEAWAGKRDDELAAVSGVADAYFCHNARFMAMTHTKEGAIRLAEIAAEA